MTFGLFSKPSLDSELLDACSRADEAKALALLACGARPSSSGPQGSTCLMFAARHDLPELFLELCKKPGLAHARDQRGR